LAFFFALYHKSHNLYGTNKLFISKWIIKLNKRIKKIYLDFNLPSCSMILSNSFCYSVISFIPFRFFLVVKICKRNFHL
jgi:hypothetical protein